MIVLGGGAVACFALGYLGLHYMGGEEIKDDVKNEINKMSNDLEEEKTNVDNNENKTNVDNNETPAWGQFWKNSFNEQDNDKKTSVDKEEDLNASDFN